MKKILLFLLLSCSSLIVFSQDIIKISADIELIRLSENTFIHVSYFKSAEYGRMSANGVIFINRDEALLFDTPCTDTLTETLCRYIEDTMHLKIRGFVPNHWHEDCMGGLKYLQSLHVPSFAGEKTIEIAKQRGLPVPGTGFRDSLKISLGNRHVLCWYPGPAHSTDNIVVWIPSEKILFAGCMCKSSGSVNLGNVADGSIADYPATIEKLIERFRSADMVIPGHGPAGGIELLYHTKTLAGRQN